MKPNRTPRSEYWKSLCGGLGPDDGVDPRDFFRPQRDRKLHHKTWQLCAQVQRTLDFVLSGECGDDVLRGLMVQSVLPAPDSSRLLVTVAPADPSSPVDSGRILERLAFLSGRLRHEVSQSITRRKTPQLSFAVAAAGVPEPSTPVEDDSREEDRT